MTTGYLMFISLTWSVTIAIVCSVDGVAGGCGCCAVMWVWLIASFSVCMAMITSRDTPVVVAMIFLLTAESDRVVLVTDQGHH